jgi:predicted kinase
VATEQTALSERERAAVQQVADQRGISFEEAAEQMAKEGLASRVRRKTGRAPAKVYDMPRKKP